MEVLLLELIVSSGLHIATTSKRKDMWNQINRDIFHNALFLTFKDEHFKEGDYRKLRDKFTLLKKESSKLMDDGNKSKYGGELSPKFKLLNQIIAEESAAEIDNSNKKSADDEERKLIQETGDRVVAGKVSKSLLTWMEAYLIIEFQRRRTRSKSISCAKWRTTTLLIQREKWGSVFLVGSPAMGRPYRTSS